MLVAHSMRPFLRLLPFQFGKGRLAHYILEPAEIPSELVRTKSGVVVHTRRDKMYRDIYLYGEYEQSLTACIKKIVKPGFLCLDIGANFGYYSVLLAGLTKAKAKVHSFEPVPFIHELTQETIYQNGVQECVVLNNCGLGIKSGEFTVYSFRDLPHGHSSSNDLGRSDAVPHLCKINTLDGYADQHGIEAVDFIKIDVEGDELSALQGGERLLRRSNATIAFEVNVPCLVARDVAPQAIEDFLRSCGYSEFFKVPNRGSSHKVPHLAQGEGFNYIAFKHSETQHPTDLETRSRR